MLELLTGTGLAMAAGLNAYIPLLALGLVARFSDLLTLPAAWAWLENGWVMGILGVLLLIEFVADKIPAVDTVNDWIQTIVRPSAGGLAFGSGSASQTVAVTDPARFLDSVGWGSVVTGVLIALAVHLAKMAVRPVLNAVTAGIAAPVTSLLEDAASVALVVSAILVPVLVVLAIPALVLAVVWAVRFVRRRRRAPARPAR
ncbi:MAG: DUF4126 domain-containing protein [Burkholderiaceae bacterium]|nr:DUF4126 domain-containing protein [Microbacteriaceae bacterium]